MGDEWNYDDRNNIIGVVLEIGGWLLNFDVLCKQFKHEKEQEFLKENRIEGTEFTKKPHKNKHSNQSIHNHFSWLNNRETSFEATRN